MVNRTVRRKRGGFATVVRLRKTLSINGAPRFASPGISADFSIDQPNRFIWLNYCFVGYI
jgi:hypothetical protein